MLYAIKPSKVKYLFLAIGAHVLFNIPAALYQSKIIENILIVETLIFIGALISVGYIFKFKIKFSFGK